MKICISWKVHPSTRYQNETLPTINRALKRLKSNNTCGFGRGKPAINQTSNSENWKSQNSESQNSQNSKSENPKIGPRFSILLHPVIAKFSCWHGSRFFIEFSLGRNFLICFLRRRGWRTFNRWRVSFWRANGSERLRSCDCRCSHSPKWHRRDCHHSNEVLRNVFVLT